MGAFWCLLWGGIGGAAASPLILLLHGKIAHEKGGCLFRAGIAGGLITDNQAATLGFFWGR